MKTEFATKTDKKCTPESLFFAKGGFGVDFETPGSPQEDSGHSWDAKKSSPEHPGMPLEPSRDGSGNPPGTPSGQDPQKGAEFFVRRVQNIVKYILS